MKTKKETLEQIKRTLAEEKECYIFLDGYKNQMYTCINAGSKVEDPKYNISRIFNHTEKTLYSIPYKKNTSMDDYSILQDIYNSIGLPDIVSVVQHRFNKDKKVKYSQMGKHMYDYKCGIHVENNNGMYTTQMIYAVCNDHKPYTVVPETRATSDCLEKALMLSMQNLNMHELVQEFIVVNCDLKNVLPIDSSLYTMAEGRLSQIHDEMTILKKQRHFTNLIPEKSFEM